MKFYLLSFAFLLSFFISPDVHPQVYKTQNGYAEFKAKASLHTYKGKSNNLEGKIDLEQSTVNFQLRIKSIKTGIKKRNRDMYKLLEIEQYPFVKFDGKLISDFDQESSTKQNVKVSGDFTLHGVTKKLEIEGTLQKTNKGLKAEATWPIMITNYNTTPPRILFFKVRDKHILSIDALLTQ